MEISNKTRSEVLLGEISKHLEDLSGEIYEIRRILGVREQREGSKWRKKAAARRRSMDDQAQAVDGLGP